MPREAHYCASPDNTVNHELLRDRTESLDKNPHAINGSENRRAGQSGFTNIANQGGCRAAEVDWCGAGSQKLEQVHYDLDLSVVFTLQELKDDH